MNEHDAIRHLIEAVDKQADAEQALRRLSDGNGAPGRVFEMAAEDIPEQTGLSKKAAAALDMVDELSRYIYTEQMGPGPLLDSAERTGAYFSELLRGRHVEYCYVGCLDDNKRLMRCICVGRGTYDASAVYVRDIVRCVLLSGARNAVIAHNHPGGTLRPSGEDINLTRSAKEALAMIGARLTEHVIVTATGWIGIINNGYLDSGNGKEKSK